METCERRPRHPLTVASCVALCGLGTIPSPRAAEPACPAPEQRALDFWLGEWEVFNPEKPRPDGAPAARVSDGETWEVVLRLEYRRVAASANARDRRP